MNKTVAAIIIPVLLIVGLAGYIILNQDEDPTTTNQTAQQANDSTIETSAFSINVPDGVTNESDSESGAIDFDLDKSYGTMSVEIFTSSLPISSREETGTVTEETVSIAGTQAERKDIDYALAVSGQSDEPTIRYSIRFDGIDKPSADKRTKITINLLSTDDISSEDLQRFKQDAQSILDSLVIK